MLTFTTIINWKELVEQFGYTKNPQGAMSAKDLNKELTKKAKNPNINPLNIAIEYNPQLTEAVALFVYSHTVTSEFTTAHHYEYSGTAN
jgi:hypothetical protein